MLFRLIWDRVKLSEVGELVLRVEMLEVFIILQLWDIQSIFVFISFTMGGALAVTSRFPCGTRRWDVKLKRCRLATWTL